MNYSVSSLISLISRIHSITADFTNKKLLSLGNLSSSHGFILYLLSIEGTLSKGEISQRINRDKSTTTSLIKKLIADGLVQETPDSADSRIKNISLTDKGMALSPITSQISKELLEVCYKGFSEREKEQLLSLLCRMNENVEKALQ